MTNTYTLTFRGQPVQTFTSVHDQQAVLLGYRRFHDEGQNSLVDVPNGPVSRKPEVLRKMKTLAALKRDGVPRRFATYPGQSFCVVVRPGTTEITEVETL